MLNIMNSIETMNLEIGLQSNYLPSLQLPTLRNPENCIFVGNGDSYVAGLISTYVSGFQSITLNPLDVISLSKIDEGREVFFVSISGKTSTNIRAASILNARGIHTTAITANSKSPLANTCKDLITINIPTSTQATAGTLSFTAATVICLSLVSDVETKLIPNIYRDCQKMMQEYNDIEFKPHLYFFLGNDFLFPCAIYGKLKIMEIFGFHSDAVPIDEFFHAPIFGANVEDTIFLLEKNEIESTEWYTKIRKMLSEVGLASISIKCGDSSVFEIILYSIFLQQSIFAKQAEKLKLKECSFLLNKKSLSVSSKVIYGRYLKI